ncbi:MAG: hypothetical protein ACM3KE_06865 [Hyphomicrobiales bacterium]
MALAGGQEVELVEGQVEPEVVARVEVAVLAVPVQAVVREPGQVAAAGLEPASVRPQDLAWAWGREPRWVLGLMHQ